MAPIWKSYIEPGKTNAILYVVDTSSPETLGASTIHLIDLLSHSSIANITPVLIVFRLVNIYMQCMKSILMNITLLNTARVVNQNLYFTCFSKTDLKGSRTLAEVRNVMRINHLLSTGVNSQLITLVNFNVVTKENVETVFDWCMQFVIPAPVTEPAQ